MAEKEYIEREALLYEIDKCEPMNWTGSDAENQADLDHGLYRGLVTDAPAADVVEVVRCKDCKHLTVYNSPTLYAYCEKTHFRFEPFQTDTRTHFCSYGEKGETVKPTVCANCGYEMYFTDGTCHYCGAKVDGKGDAE